MFSRLFCILSSLIWQVFCQLSSFTISYTNLGFNSSSQTVLVIISSSCKTPPYHTVLWKFHSSPFHTKCIPLEICLVCLVYLPLISMHRADLPFNIMRCSCYGTTYGSMFNNSILGILKCSRSITVVHAALYSLLALDW